jgi:hypothetical protein
VLLAKRRLHWAYHSIREPEIRHRQAKRWLSTQAPLCAGLFLTAALFGNLSPPSFVECLVEQQACPAPLPSPSCPESEAAFLAALNALAPGECGGHT